MDPSSRTEYLARSDLQVSQAQPVIWSEHWIDPIHELARHEINDERCDRTGKCQLLHDRMIAAGFPE